MWRTVRNFRDAEEFATAALLSSPMRADMRGRMVVKSCDIYIKGKGTLCEKVCEKVCIKKRNKMGVVLLSNV